MPSVSEQQIIDVEERLRLAMLSCDVEALEVPNFSRSHFHQSPRSGRQQAGRSGVSSSLCIQVANDQTIRKKNKVY